jgi:hypothetical protein
VIEQQIKESVTPVLKSKNGTLSQQLDTVIELLANINNSTSSLDEYIAEATGGKIVTTSLKN